MYRPWVQWHVSADSQLDMIFLTIASDVIAKRMKNMFFFHGVMVMVFLFGANVEKMCIRDSISDFNGICLSGGGENLLMVSNGVDYGFGGTDETFIINGKQYRGCLRFAVNGTVMTAVNVVDLEEYLYGVIPAEMPASYSEEALKAQTLAARTYAMTKLSAHKSSGYELCDTINCQVYKGYSGENSKTNAIAVSYTHLCYRPWYRLCRCSGRFSETERNFLYP